MARLRPAAVAGSFYPDEPAEVRAMLAGMLRDAPAPAPAAAPRPKALIVPHAGWIYSGPIAAAAYRLLEPLRGKIARVVLLGPAHRVPVEGLALPGASGFETPLGTVAVDEEAARRLPAVTSSPLAHRDEHSLEVQLPFLQTTLGEGFTLTPFVVGDALPEEVAGVLDALWGGDETLFVISTDLSHYHSYAEAKARDAETAETIEARGRVGYDDACGAAPLNGMLLAAKRRNLSVTRLDLRSSGDTAGPRDRVVGYGAWAVS